VKGRKQPNRPETPAVTLERAARLHCLLHLLRATPRPRDWLKNRLSLDVRGFYRDLELLRSCGISVPLNEGCYILEGSVSDAVARLPFPDPRLTLGEAVQLARGRTTAHRKLKEQLARITATAAGATKRAGGRRPKTSKK